jgi:DNA-binding CsgD family transcriptional regulator
LTPREREIVGFILKGHSAEATGQALGVASGTVRIHRRNIYAKLGRRVHPLALAATILAVQVVACYRVECRIISALWVGVSMFS